MADEPAAPLQVPEGTVIFRQGDSGDRMFVICKGRVRLWLDVRGHAKEIGIFGEGEFLGDLSLLSGVPRSATAQAIEACTLLPISRDIFAMMVQDDLDIVFRMLQMQSQRLHRTNEPIQALVEQIRRIRVVAHCLERALAGAPVTVVGADVSGELHVSPEDVAATIGDLVGRGAGRLRDGQWVADGNDVPALVEALRAYAARET